MRTLTIPSTLSGFSLCLSSPLQIRLQPIDLRIRLGKDCLPFTMTFLNFLAATLLENRMSNSANENPDVSGSRMNVQMIQMIPVAAQNIPDLAFQPQAVLETIYGLRVFTMIELTTYTNRPRAMD